VIDNEIFEVENVPNSEVMRPLSEELELELA
jgi:hypothetical protein